MNNYPLGAENDPRAPFNQKGDDSLCIHCDYDKISAIADENAKALAAKMNAGLPDGAEQFDSEDFYDSCLEDAMNAWNQCKQCYLEERADDWEEDI